MQEICPDHSPLPFNLLFLCNSSVCVLSWENIFQTPYLSAQGRRRVECSPPSSTPMTAPPMTHLSNYSTLLMTTPWSVSTQTVTSPSNMERLTAWWPGAVATTWNSTQSKLCSWWLTSENVPHRLSPSILMLQESARPSHSNTWEPPSPTTSNGRTTSQG